MKIKLLQVKFIIQLLYRYDKYLWKFLLSGFAIELSPTIYKLIT